MITNARVALKALKALKPASMNVNFSTKKVQAEAHETQVSAEKPAKKSQAKKKAE